MMADYGNYPSNRGEIGLQWLGFVLLGVALIILGFIAIGSAVQATLISVGLLGVLLVVGGIFEIIHAFWAKAWSGFWMDLLLGALLVLTGLLLLNRPIISAFSITMIFSLYLMISGSFRMIASVVQRFENWGWVLASGVLSLILGMLIWAGLPSASLFIIGLFVGIDLIFMGMTWTILGFQLHRYLPPGARGV